MQLWSTCPGLNKKHSPTTITSAPRMQSPCQHGSKPTTFGYGGVRNGTQEITLSCLNLTESTCLRPQGTGRNRLNNSQLPPKFSVDSFFVKTDVPPSHEDKTIFGRRRSRGRGGTQVWSHEQPGSSSSSPPWPGRRRRCTPLSCRALRGT